MKHDLNEIVRLGKMLEEEMIPLGLHVVAIGGSCVHKNGSNKDMDIFIYVHAEETVSNYISKAKDKLSELGFLPQYETEPTKVYSVYPTKFKDKDIKVDFFFLERILYDDNELDEDATPWSK